VIHAGIYYPQNSLKARLCVEGRHQLYAFCEKYNVPHHRSGKLVVAADDSQGLALLALQQNAVDNGVNDTSILDASELARLEPEVVGNAALYSPSTGIVDSHALMTALTGITESRGGTICLDTQFHAAEHHGSDYIVEASSVGEVCRFRTGTLVNCAGLDACGVAGNIEGVDPASIPPLFYCKGSYFTLRGRSPFRHLIYPLPETDSAGLGVHATLDLGGQVRFGPDTEYVGSLDYNVDERKRDGFLIAIRSYFPGIEARRLAPAYSGIRPKLQPQGGAAADFRVELSAPGVVSLYGIESPGLTASLAIGDYVTTILNIM
jgi:L-2-hydroxyglutarate oxidase LhgO